MSNPFSTYHLNHRPPHIQGKEGMHTILILPPIIVVGTALIPIWLIKPHGPRPDGLIEYSPANGSIYVVNGFIL